MPLLFEFKARSTKNLEFEQLVREKGGRFVGEDKQVDTYFNCTAGRLKLREGTIENALIHYHRDNIAGAKTSRVTLYQHQPDPNLKQVLTNALGIKVVVEKKRRIWFVNNVKIHFDYIEGLGSFVEVEAIDYDETIGLDSLKKQCYSFASLFDIQASDYEASSYSGMLLKLKPAEQITTEQ
jgi:predicted adenylyl cyclase CyaB